MSASVVAWFIGATVLLSSPSCSVPTRSGVESQTTGGYIIMVQCIGNNDLKWEGTYLGLHPTISRLETVVLVESKDPIESTLVGFLADPSRFAIAHVLLTYRSKTSFTVDGGQWNGLHVNLDVSGAVRYDERDMPILHARWRAFLGEQGAR